MVKTVATSNDAMRTGNNKHVIQLIATGGDNRKQANIAASSRKVQRQFN